MRRAFFLSCLLLTVVLSGCGGGFNSAMNQGVVLSVTPPVASLALGGVLQLQAIGSFTGANGISQRTTPVGTWSSSDAGIVTVNSSGVLLGTGLGNATVTFTCPACLNQTVFVAIAVTPVATSLTISPINATIHSGSSFQFDAAATIDGAQQDVTSVAVWTLDNYLGGAASIGSGLLLTNQGAVTTQTVIQVTVSYAGLHASAPVFVNP